MSVIDVDKEHKMFVISTFYVMISGMVRSRQIVQ